MSDEILLSSILAQGKDPGGLGDPESVTETQTDFDVASPEEIAEAIDTFGDGGKI
jgi:hypothetical protein